MIFLFMLVPSWDGHLQEHHDETENDRAEPEEIEIFSFKVIVRTAI